MMRSLFSGVSGLRTHQVKMDVIGNNIANVNTMAYKSSSVTFSDLMYQTTQGASGANAATGRGGINAKQIGLGVMQAAINNNIASSGASQTTGNPFDVRISGDSFFVVNDGNSNYFTRAGAFYVDGVGNLAMSSNGYKVMGWQEDPANPGSVKKDTVSALQIMSAANMTSPAEATTDGYVTGIIDSADTELSTATGRAVNFTFYDNLGYSYTAKMSVYDYEMVAPPAGSPAGTPNVKQQLPKGVYRTELTDITDSAGKSIANGTAPNPAIGAAAGFGAVGTTTKYLKYDITSATKGAFLGFADTSADAAAITTKATDLTMNFAFNTAAGTRDAFSAFPGTINIDYSTSNICDNKGTTTINAQTGDIKNPSKGKGKKIGEMLSIAIQTDGKIFASYDNGNSKLLGQIAVATFANASGLSKVGANLYGATMNSGDFDGIGSDITENSGAMASGELEMSNVDLSAEFTEMITTQRGFQANSRIITVSDTMLEELTNLKR